MVRMFEKTGCASCSILRNPTPFKIPCNRDACRLRSKQIIQPAPEFRERYFPRVPRADGREHVRISDSGFEAVQPSRGNSAPLRA